MFENKDFSHLLSTPGFSDTLLNNHFILYQGYVKNSNNALELLKTADAYQYGEIKRRYGWEFNGMRLHELYFGNMSNGGTNMLDELKTELETAFGSLTVFKDDFIKTASMRGIGWVVLTYDKESNRFFNTWINEHDLGFLAGTVPLLVMDVFEHAFVTDYGLKKTDYIENFWQAIDWEVVEERLTNLANTAIY